MGSRREVDRPRLDCDDYFYLVFGSRFCSGPVLLGVADADLWKGKARCGAMRYDADECVDPSVVVVKERGLRCDEGESARSHAVYRCISIGGSRYAQLCHKLCCLTRGLPPVNVSATHIPVALVVRFQA